MWFFYLLIFTVSASDECKLYCRVKDNTLYFLLEPKVRDGTPCNQDRFSKCVNGHCHQAGCDNILYSDAVPGKFFALKQIETLCLVLI